MSLKRKAISGLLWTYGQQFGTQVLNFIINLILARLLLPSDFGAIGLLSVFISISGIIIGGGLTTSLIRKKDTSTKDLDTIFVINIISAFFIYLIIFFISPYVEEFYTSKGLASVLRVYSISLIISSFGVVQQAILVKDLNFKRETYIALPSIIVSGILGIFLAFKGAGVWSLVWFNIARVFINTIQLWIYSNWKPSFKFSKSHFRYHFNFGFKFSLIEIIRTLFANIYPIVLGKGFSLNQAGLFKQAETIRLLPFSNIVSSVNKVTFPLYSSVQDDKLKLKKIHSKLSLMLFTLMSPIFIYMSILSEDIIILFFSEKWIQAAPYLAILSIGSLLSVININNLNVLNVTGKVNVIFKIEIIEKVIFVLLLAVCIVFKLGIINLLLAEIVRGVISVLLKEYFGSKELNVPMGNLLLKLCLPLILTLSSGIVVYFLKEYLTIITSITIIKVMIPAISGGLLYTFLCFVFYKDMIIEMFDLLKFKK